MLTSAIVPWPQVFEAGPTVYGAQGYPGETGTLWLPFSGELDDVCA